MMSAFSFPERPVSEIIGVLAETNIAALKPDDLTNPTADVVSSIYTNFISYVDTLGDVPDDQIGFTALELLDNPDQHVESIRVLNLYRKIKDLLASIRYPNFTLRDLLKPDGKRTIHILSTVVNFLYYREDKLNILRPVFEQLPDYEERKKELETKIIAELNKEIMDCEVARQLEEPIVQEVDAEVKKLKQAITNYNKQQVALKTVYKGLKEKIEEIIEKIAQADFELVKNVQENSKLLSRIVQSPDKLQRALEEKKATRTEAKDSEKLAMQNVQKRTTTIEVYLKAYEKWSKHFSQMQALQEQVSSSKSVEKDVKACKAKLSEEGVSNISLDAKIDEWLGRAKQADELIKAMEKERDTRYEQDSQRLENLRTELEWKLHCLEPREKAVEAMVAKGDGLCSDVVSVRDAGKVKQQQLQAKIEEIVDMFYSYSNMIDGALQNVEMTVTNEPWGAQIVN